MHLSRAAVLEKFGDPLRLCEFPLPRQIEPGAALVRIEMAGICGTDVHIWKGELPVQLPIILGHETVGRLVEVGQGLTHDWRREPLQLGDRVTWTSAISCGRCFYCAKKKQPTRCPERRAYGIGYPADQAPHLWGGYAQYHYLRPGTNLFKLPDDLSTESVIGAGCALVTAIHGMERICVERASPQPAQPSALPRLPDLWRDHIVIQGAGPVGLSCAAISKNAGAENIIMIGGPAARLALAKQFGVNHTIDIADVPVPAERIEQVRQLTGGYGADVVVECVGAPAVVSEGIEMCRDGAKYLILGHYCNAGTAELNPHLITRKQLQFFGSWSSEPRHMHSAISFIRSQSPAFPFSSIVSHRFPLEQATEALAATARWAAAKSVIVPTVQP